MPVPRVGSERCFAQLGLRATVLSTTIAIGLVPAPAAPQAPQRAQPTWSLAATGDSIITRPISVYDDAPFLGLVEVLRGADTAFTNLEITLLRLSEFKGYPGGGDWFEIGPPEVAADLKQIGIDVVSRANNHTVDWGIEGMLETNRLLDAVGIAHAGTGINVGEATQPAFVQSKNGRAAVISLATTFDWWGRAGEVRQDVKGRPGLNALRVTRTYQLSPARMSELRRIITELGGRVPAEPDAPVSFMSVTGVPLSGGLTFAPGPVSKVLEKVNARDEERILRSVRSAARQADYVIVTSHSHEPSNDSQEPPAFLVEFAKKCIDSGADTYIVHGPHQLRGIEIYQGKPIFYSLGNFVFQYETETAWPADMYERYGLGHDAIPADLLDTESKLWPLTSNAIWWQSVVAVPVFRGDTLIEMRLHPIELGLERPATERGTPRLAQGAGARSIVEHLAKLSVPFGTTIAFEGGIGVWRPAAQPARPTSN